MKKFFQKSKTFHFLSAAAFSSLIAIPFVNSQFGTTVERETLDWRMRAAAGSRRPDSSVVIAAIDQKSLTFFQKNGVAWPWPREFYGILLDYLHEGGARVVAFDMDFSQRDMDRLNVDAAASDSSFARAINSSGNAILISVLTKNESSPDQTIDTSFSLPVSQVKAAAPRFTSCVAPLAEFQKGAAAIGVANYFVDVDGVARRMPMLFNLNGRIFPQLSLAAYAVGKRLTPAGLLRFINGVPTDHDGNYIVNWYGRGGPGGVFRYYSIGAMLLSAVQMKQGKTPEIPPSIFRNKYVIVGGTAIGLMDYVSTPFTSIEPFPGAEIHATMLSNFLQRDFISDPSGSTGYFLIAFLALLSAGILMRVKRVSLSVGIVVALCGSYAAAAFVLMTSFRIWLPLVGPETSALSAFAFAGVLSYVTEGRQRRELRRLMNRYISPDVVDEISADPDTVDLRGKEIEATVFFSDIRDFTSISERLQPRELVEYLNEYFTLTTELILNSGAMLDKYIGDAIMAVFGAPLPIQDHAAVACRTALRIQKTLLDYYASRGGERPVLETRIGLNTGKMVIGNIGSERRTDYTAIGDTVNLASRLEGVNKQFGTRIIISESTYEQARDSIEVRELDLVRVKGKNIPVRIFELVAEKGELAGDELKTFSEFNEGLKYYRAKEWEKATAAFENVLAAKPGDGPSSTYIARCRTLSSEGVPDDWDGVYSFKTK